jgi:hypothetical protein
MLPFHAAGDAALSARSSEPEMEILSGLRHQCNIYAIIIAIANAVEVVVACI